MLGRVHLSLELMEAKIYVFNLLLLWIILVLLCNIGLSMVLVAFK